MFGAPWKTVKILEPNEEAEISKIRELLEAIAGEWSWITFDCEDSDGPIEVAFDPGHFSINIGHAEKDGLVSKLHAAGISIPETWTVIRDQKKGFLRGGSLDLSIPADQALSIASLVRILGEFVAGWKEDKLITATFQR